MPVIDHNGKTLHDSAKIISYLDEAFPKKKLSPVNPTDAASAIEWERYLDKEVGVHVRRIAYQTLLDHPKIVSPFFTTGGPFWGPLYVKFAYPKLRKIMRKFMNINAEAAAESLEHLKAALDRLETATTGKKFLAGNQFSRADLSAASLLSPLFMPPQYGLPWPAGIPEPLAGIILELEPKLQWAKAMYSEYR